MPTSIDERVVFLKCRLDHLVDGFGEASVVAGRVAAAHVHLDASRSTEKDDHELINRSPLLAHLNPGRCAHVSKSYSFPIPAGFQR